MTNKMTSSEQVKGAVTKADRVMESCTLVLFGASGDLAQRMVVPAIFRLARRGLLSPEFRLIGYARSKMTDDDFRQRMREAVSREIGAGDEQAWTEVRRWFVLPFGRIRWRGLGGLCRTHAQVRGA